MTTETHAERTNRHLAMLAELSGLTMQLAREAAQTALDEPGDPKHKLAFNRLATTIHRLIALEAKLAAPSPASGERPDDGKRASTSPPTHNPERTRVGRIVRDNLKRAIDGPTLRDVNRYLETRLTQPDVDEAIESTQPIGVIARTICQELNIPFDLAQQPDDVICRRPKPESSLTPS
jgi:hypothetical protein